MTSIFVMWCNLRRGYGSKWTLVYLDRAVTHNVATADHGLLIRTRDEKVPGPALVGKNVRNVAASVVHDRHGERLNGLRIGWRGELVGLRAKPVHVQGLTSSLFEGLAMQPMFRAPWVGKRGGVDIQSHSVLQKRLPER
jgi:hypothetical protein